MRLDNEHQIDPQRLSNLVTEGASLFTDGLSENAADFYDAVASLAKLLADEAFLTDYPDDTEANVRAQANLATFYGEHMPTLFSYRLDHLLY